MDPGQVPPLSPALPLSTLFSAILMFRLTMTTVKLQNFIGTTATGDNEVDHVIDSIPSPDVGQDVFQSQGASNYLISKYWGHSYE